MISLNSILHSERTQDSDAFACPGAKRALWGKRISRVAASVGRLFQMMAEGMLSVVTTAFICKPHVKP